MAQKRDAVAAHLHIQLEQVRTQLMSQPDGGPGILGHAAFDLDPHVRPCLVADRNRLVTVKLVRANQPIALEDADDRPLARGASRPDERPTGQRDQRSDEQHVEYREPAKVTFQAVESLDRFGRGRNRQRTCGPDTRRRCTPMSGQMES